MNINRLNVMKKNSSIPFALSGIIFLRGVLYYQ